MADSKLARLRNAEHKLRRKDDIKEEMALILGPHVNWEKFLIPAPYTICILGQLLLISTQRDFSLENSEPKDGFKYLAYPKSFRGSLMQVSNGGYECFKCADKNMSAIRLLSGKVPDLMKSVVRYLLKGTPREIERHLPIELDAIEENALECKAKAEEVEKKFDELTKLIGELLEAAVVTKSGYDKELVTVEKRKKALEEEKKGAKASDDEATEKQEKILKRLEKVEKMYDSAVDSLPTGKGAFGLLVMETAASNVSTILDSYMSAKMLSMGNMLKVTHMSKTLINAGQDFMVSYNNKSGASSTDGKEGNMQSVSNEDEDSLRLFDIVDEINNYVNRLASVYVNGDTLNMENLTSNNDMIDVSEFLRQKRKHIEGISDSKLKDEIRQVLEKGQKICELLEQANKDINIDDTQVKTIHSKIKELQSIIMGLYISRNVLIGGNTFKPLTPCQAAYEPNVENKEGSAFKMMSSNAQLKIASAEKQLECLQREFEKANKYKREAKDRLTQVMVEMSEINFKEIDFKAIKDTLKKGISALGELRKNWQLLVSFFSMMANMIKISLAGPMEKFVKHSETAAVDKLQGYGLGELLKDELYLCAFQCVKIAHVVEMISETYVKVSSDHLMHKIAGLGKLLQYDSENDKKVIEREYRELTGNLLSAQDEIDILVRNQQKKFSKSIEGRLSRIKDEMKSVLPALDETDAACIESAKACSNIVIAEKLAQIDTSTLNIDDF